jgi:hypothetical protein
MGSSVAGDDDAETTGVAVAIADLGIKSRGWVASADLTETEP